MGIFKMQRNFLVSKTTISEGLGMVSERRSSLSVKKFLHPCETPRDTAEVQDFDTFEVI